jgi:sugar phosphate permease
MGANSQTRVGKGGGIFYGWYIVVIAFMANFMSVGTGFYALNAFMQPLCDARGWTRTDINIALVIGTFFTLAGQLLYGTLVIRVGPRILMLLGSIVASIAFILLGRAQVLVYFYSLYALLVVGNGAYGGIVANTTVNNWFMVKRGRALGLATAGISLSGAILPFVAMIMVLRSDIASAFLWIGLSIMAIGPLAWLVVRDWPENYGLVPDGVLPQDIPTVTEKTSTQQPGPSRSQVRWQSPYTGTERRPSWTPSMLIRTGTFWKLGLAFALVMIGVAGVMSQLKPRFSDIGFGDMAAMGMMATTAFFATIGKYAWGLLCDRFDPRRVVAVLVALNGLGLSLGLLHGSFLALILFIMIFGFAMGGVMSTYPIIVAHLFGRKSFPSVIKLVSLFLILQMSGYVIAGQSFDRMGSYDPAWVLMTLHMPYSSPST